jgi:hypothetical protein
MEEGFSKDNFGSSKGFRGSVRGGDPAHNSQLPREKAGSGGHHAIGDDKKWRLLVNDSQEKLHGNAGIGQKKTIRKGGRNY